MAHQEDHPGPIEPSVLHLQPTHRSQAVWEGSDIEDTNWRAFHNETAWREGYVGHLDPRVLRYVHAAGFYGMLQVGSMRIDWHLIRAMIERWREETHTFHLPVGEATITLQDVEVLLGLRVDGLAVTDWFPGPSGPRAMSVLCQELLGFTPTFNKGSSIKITDITMFIAAHPLAADSPDDLIRQHARCLCMLMIHLIVADKSGNLVDTIYLPFLEDFDMCGRYSWGSAALAHLYRNLCLASRRGCKAVAGLTLLVHIWAWSRISNIRPEVRPPVIDDPLRLGVGPAAVFWSRAELDQTRVPSHSITFYRDQLDMMLPEHMSWQPYLALAQLPAYCSGGAGVYLYRGPLICFHIVELHAPDRVLRQFGLMQSVPIPIDTDRQLHDVARRARSLPWHERHATYLASWHARRESLVGGSIFSGVMLLTDPYMEWYRRITRRVIGRAALPAPRRGSQPVAGLHDLSVARFAEMGQSIYSMLGDPGRSYDQSTGTHLQHLYQTCQDSLDIYGQRYRLDHPAPDVPIIPTMPQSTSRQYGSAFSPFAGGFSGGFGGLSAAGVGAGFSQFQMGDSSGGGGYYGGSQYQHYMQPPDVGPSFQMPSSYIDPHAFMPTQTTQGLEDYGDEAEEEAEEEDEDLEMAYDPTQQRVPETQRRTRPTRTIRRPRCGTGSHYL